MPEILDTVRGNRRFLARAVEFVNGTGVRQFIDLGSGLPHAPNVHEIARDSRVLYVDNDPVVYNHAVALMGTPGTVTSALADLRDTSTVLDRAGESLDLSQPIGLLFVGCLHHIVDSDDPAATWSFHTSPTSSPRRRCGPTRMWRKAAGRCSFRAARKRSPGCSMAGNWSIPASYWYRNGAQRVVPRIRERTAPGRTRGSRR